jgi:hypothetical protein
MVELEFLDFMFTYAFKVVERRFNDDYYNLEAFI